MANYQQASHLLGQTREEIKEAILKNLLFMAQTVSRIDQIGTMLMNGANGTSAEVLPQTAIEGPKKKRLKRPPLVCVVPGCGAEFTWYRYTDRHKHYAEAHPGLDLKNKRPDRIKKMFETKVTPVITKERILRLGGGLESGFTGKEMIILLEREAGRPLTELEQNSLRARISDMVRAGSVVKMREKRNGLKLYKPAK